jgi:hypothetical protein
MCQFLIIQSKLLISSVPRDFDDTHLVPPSAPLHDYIAQFAALTGALWAVQLHSSLLMSEYEFIFSVALLAFAGALLILGTLILLDSFRRLIDEFVLKPARKKNRRVVAVVEIARPVAQRVGDGGRDFVERPVVIADKKVS